MNSDVIHFGKLFLVFQKVFYSNIHCCRRILIYNRDVVTLRAENFELLLKNLKQKQPNVAGVKLRNGKQRRVQQNWRK
jgi:hypothetical protein